VPELGIKKSQKLLALAGLSNDIPVIVAQMFSMKAFRKKRQGVSALLLCLFLSLQAMAVFPALHALVHPDACDPDHECAVTLFSHGQVDASPAAAPVFCAPARLVFRQSPPDVIFVSADIRLLPSRGPPASSALV
jgi:hypothetical protein